MPPPVLGTRGSDDFDGGALGAGVQFRHPLVLGPRVLLGTPPPRPR